MAVPNREIGEGKVAQLLRFLIKQIDRLTKVVSASGGGGGGAVDVTAIGGNPVTTTLPVSGTVAVTGVSTAANQTTGNALLASIDTKTPALGIATSANSTPVVLASDSAAINVFNSELMTPGAAAQTAIVANILTNPSGAVATDANGYKSASIQVVSTASGGTYIFEGSNDNVNFQAIPVFNQVILTGTPIVTAITATSSQIIYSLPVRARHIRLRIVTTITGGSIQAFTRLSQESWSPAIYQVAQATAANLNTTVTGTLTAVTTVTTLANGQTAHSSASTGSPVRVGGRVLPATPDVTLAAGDASDVGITTGQQQLIKTYAAGEQDFTFNGVITNSATAVPFKAAAGASIRNWLTSLGLTSDTLGAATELIIKDGDIAGTSVAANVFTSAAHDFKIGDQVVFSVINTFTGATTNTSYWVLTVPSSTTFTLSATPNGSVLAITGTGTFTISRILFRTKLQTTSLAPILIRFETPLRGAPNAIMSIQTITASITGSVYYNTAGYIGV